MITLTIIIMVLIIYLNRKKNYHNNPVDRNIVAQIPPFTFRARPMSQFSKFLNLAYDDRCLLDQFSFNNGMVYMRMKDGQAVEAPISNIFLEASKYKSGPISYKVWTPYWKVQFYQTTNIPNVEWDAINAVLSLAGTTRGEIYLGNKHKSIGHVNTVLRALNSQT